MLGRLFNNRSTENIDSHNHRHHSVSKSNLTKKLSSNSIQGYPPTNDPHPSQQQPLSNYTNEDSYSRTILYGTPNHLSSTPVEKHNFRMLIIQDKGVLLQRDNYNILFDSANNHHFDKHSTTKLQNRHSTHELLDFIFGNPIYQDLNRDDYFKIHVLSSLPDLKNSILITKHFFIDKKKRYAIGVVIPVGLMDFSKSILSNWTAVIKNLNLIKATVIENHILNKSKCQVCSAANPYSDVILIFKQFIKSINQLTTTPRLLVGLIKFDSILYNWCFEVNNWIEIKDGAKLGFNGTKFLTTLLTIVNGIKTQLISHNGSTEEFTRIVIMAANPIVAQKLIFIISGLLPFKLNFEIEQVPKPKPTSKPRPTLKIDPIEITPVVTASSEISLPPIDTLQFTPPTPSISSKFGWEIPTTPSRTIATPSIMTPSRSSVIQPTAVSNSSSMAYLSSSLSHSQSSTFSSSLSRGFQLLQNWKNNSTFSDSSSVSSSQSQSHYKTPSPSTEFEEYPWYSTNNTNAIGNINNTIGSTPHYHHLPRTNSCYDLISASKNFKRQTVPKLPHIDRNTTTLFKIGESQKSQVQLFNKTRKECFTLMSSKLSTTIERDPFKHVNVLNVSFDDEEKLDDPQEQIIPEDETKGDSEHKHHTLPQLCGYVNEFTPDFHMQACPVSNDLESKIVASMKNDLSVYSNTKTILVSLRAREITEITLSKSNNPSGTSTIGEFKSNVKKLYFNTRASSIIDRKEFEKIDSLLEAIVNKFHETGDNPDDFKGIEEMLYSL